MRASLVRVGVVVAAGALLRFWHLGQAPVTDVETQVIEPVLQLMRTGSYRPIELTQPTLPVYLQTAVAVVHFLWGAIAGVWRSVADFGPPQMLGWGRGCSALLGTAVVFIVYQIGMRFGARHALLAAGLMAVAPTHVAISREMASGSPLTFFAALTLLLSLVAIEREHARACAAAGVAAGLTAASQYAGALIVIVPVVAVWMTPRDGSSRLTRALVTVAAAIGAFVAATPLTIRDLPAFLNGVATTASAATSARGVLEHIDILQWFVSTLEWPGVVLAFVGLSIGIVRAVTGPGHTRWTLLVGFPVVYLMLTAWHGAGSDAALLPLLPAATVLAAIAVISGVSWLRRFEIARAARTALIAALTTLALLPPALISLEIVRQAGRDAARVARGYRPGT